MKDAGLLSSSEFIKMVRWELSPESQESVIKLVLTAAYWVIKFQTPETHFIAASDEMFKFVSKMIWDSAEELQSVYQQFALKFLFGEESLRTAMSWFEEGQFETGAELEETHWIAIIKAMASSPHIHRSKTQKAIQDLNPDFCKDQTDEAATHLQLYCEAVEPSQNAKDWVWPRLSNPGLGYSISELQQMWAGFFHPLSHFVTEDYY